MQHFLKTFWFRTFHWHAVGGMQWRFLEPQFFQTWACSPDYLNQYIIRDTFNQTFFFSGFYILFQTSTPHLLWLFPHPICAEMSSDCYFQLRVSKLNKWYFKNAFILTEHRVEPAERMTDLPPSKTFTGSIFLDAESFSTPPFLFRRRWLIEATVEMMDKRVSFASYFSTAFPIKAAEGQSMSSLITC